MNCDICKHDIECYEGDCFTNGKAFADCYGFVVCADCLELVTLEECYERGIHGRNNILLKFAVKEER